MIKQKELEIENMNKIVKLKTDTIKSFEERMLTITILEHKLKSLREKHQREKEELKKYYEQEFSNLTKEIQHIHRVLSVNLANDEKIKLLQKELISYKEFNIKKIQNIEARLKQLDDLKERATEESTTHNIFSNNDLIRTEPDMSDRRKSLRPSSSTTGIVRIKPYDLASHR